MKDAIIDELQVGYGILITLTRKCLNSLFFKNQLDLTIVYTTVALHAKIGTDMSLHMYIIQGNILTN